MCLRLLQRFTSYTFNESLLAYRAALVWSNCTNCLGSKPHFLIDSWENDGRNKRALWAVWPRTFLLFKFHRKPSNEPTILHVDWCSVLRNTHSTAPAQHSFSSFPLLPTHDPDICNMPLGQILSYNKACLQKGLEVCLLHVTTASYDLSPRKPSASQINSSDKIWAAASLELLLPYS